MSSSDSDGSMDSPLGSNAGVMAKIHQEAAQPPPPCEAKGGQWGYWHRMGMSLPALSTATCCAPLPPSSVNAPFPPSSVNAQPERPKGSEEETGVKGEIRDTGLGLPAWSAAFKNILLPTATGNAQLNPPLPPSSSDINLPPSSSDINLPPSSSDINLPPSSSDINLPPSSSDINLPPSSTDAPLVARSDMNLLADPKNAPLQRCPTKAPVPTDKHSSLCPIMAPPCHQAEDTGPLSQMGALLDQLVQTHSASVGSEEFLRLAGDVFKQGIEAQNQWHHRMMEDRQRNRLANLEMAQMQLRYNRSSSLSPTPFSQEHFPQFQDVSEDTDWVLLNFEKLCAMCNVPEPDWVFYLPNALKSKAMGCYGDVPMGACCDYPAIKAALLKPYNGEPEIHRVKFRNMTLKAGETFNSFYQRLQYRYDRWMEASDIKQFKDCYRPLVLEQLLQKCPARVQQKVLKHKSCSPYQAAQIADDHLHLHPEPASQPRLDRCPPPPITDKNTDASLLQHWSMDNESILDLLDLFECHSTFHQLPKSQWVKYLCGKLKGKVLDVCLSIPQEHKRDYDFVKAEILGFYGITPETHRIKFRTIQRQDDQPFTAFYQNLLCHYNRWMAACEVQTIEQCANLMVVEQLLTRCPPEVQGRVTSMQKAPTPEAVARIADKYMILHSELQQHPP
ncbi:uncharacterized protein LOC100485453 [Xenopus tropicalis]|uniref:Uncharacterized protein LOC100485453 n=2 Tax=Xenopus tropicalis TaxID=8364 RepID=A0A8J1JS60_XENTR|nr:uncharacterized protein LOC100485453 [Xenopus tropicalis]